MEIFKILILIIAYTLGIAALIVQIICYLKDLEYEETIFFTIAFLLVIIAMTIQELVEIENPYSSQIQEFVTNLLTVLFAISIPVNIHKERVDSFRTKRNRFVVIIGIIIAVLTSVFHFVNYSFLIVMILSIHLFLTVVYSMFFVLFTKPKSLIQFREKTERLIAVIVLIIMSISFVIFMINVPENSLKLMQQNGGFVLALICIILSVSKIPGDIKKLIHQETIVSIQESKINQFGISQREQEVLVLLITGKTYKEIAAELFISLPTVKTHVSNIYSKTNVRNRLELSNLMKYDSGN